MLKYSSFLWMGILLCFQIFSQVSIAKKAFCFLLMKSSVPSFDPRCLHFFQFSSPLWVIWHSSSFSWLHFKFLWVSFGDIVSQVFLILLSASWCCQLILEGWFSPLDLTLYLGGTNRYGLVYEVVEAVLLVMVRPCCRHDLFLVVLAVDLDFLLGTRWR